MNRDFAELLRQVRDAFTRLAEVVAKAVADLADWLRRALRHVEPLAVAAADAAPVLPRPPRRIDRPAGTTATRSAGRDTARPAKARRAAS